MLKASKGAFQCYSSTGFILRSCAEYRIMHKFTLYIIIIYAYNYNIAKYDIFNKSWMRSGKSEFLFFFFQALQDGGRLTFLAGKKKTIVYTIQKLFG